MRFIRTTSTLALCLAATACAPADEIEPGAETVSRAYELTDESGQNTVTLVVTAEDEATLDELDPGNLVLAVGDGIEAPITTASNGEAEGEGDDTYRLPIEVDVIDERLADGVDAIRIFEYTPPVWRDPFSIEAHYNADDCARITRHSFWHRVWGKIMYKPDADSSYVTLLSWRKLGNGQSMDRCRRGSYRMKALVEARNHRDHYEVGFY